MTARSWRTSQPPFAANFVPPFSSPCAKALLTCFLLQAYHLQSRAAAALSEPAPLPSSEQMSSPAPSDASPPAANSPGPDGPDLAEEVGADSDSADCSDTDSGVSDLEDENDVIDMQPAHPPSQIRPPLCCSGCLSSVLSCVPPITRCLWWFSSCHLTIFFAGVLF